MTTTKQTTETKNVEISYKKYPSGLYGHSFDLTTIEKGGRGEWASFLSRNGLTEYHRVDLSEDSEDSKYQFVWHDPAKNRVVATANNPISGQHTRPGMRRDEVGYASYVSVEAEDPEQLAFMVLDLLRTARHVKDHGHGFYGLYERAAEEIGVNTADR